MASREGKTLAAVFCFLVILVALAFWWDSRRREGSEDPAGNAGGGSTAADVAADGSRPAMETGGDRPRCEACGEEIGGRRLRVRDSFFHPEHFVCAGCNEPIAGNLSEDGERYFHARCLVELKAPRCAVCGDPIVGEASIEDYWGNRYHATHAGTVPACRYCGRLFSERLQNQGREYEDGRKVCGICLESAVTDQARVKALLVETAKSLERFGIFVVDEWIQLHLVDKFELASVSGPGHEKAAGFTSFMAVDKRLDVLKRHNRKVYILKGMPEMNTRFTIAHELTHVWQGELRRLETDAAFREGSCNYAGYLVLQEFEDEQAEYVLHGVLNEKDRIYGGGFRSVKRYVEDHGREAWLDRLRNENALPLGY